MKYDEPPIKAWSWSALNGMNGKTGCPLRVALEKVVKVKVPQNPAMIYGNKVHGIGETFIKTKPDEVPEEFMGHEDFMLMLRDDPTTVAEEKWVMDRNWILLDQRQWFNKHLEGLRASADLYRFPDGEDKIIITDWKTGKYRDGYSEQVELYALLAFEIFEDDLEYVETEIAYVGHVKGKLNDRFVGRKNGKWDGRSERGYHFSRKKDYARLRRKWDQRSFYILEATHFPPNQNNPYCGWCPHRKSQGGDCPLDR